MAVPCLIANSDRLAVSRAGVNVLTANQAQMLFSTDASALRLYKRGIMQCPARTADSPGYSATEVMYGHDFGQVPFVLLATGYYEYGLSTAPGEALYLSMYISYLRQALSDNPSEVWNEVTCERDRFKLRLRGNGSRPGFNCRYAIYYWNFY